MSPLCHSNSPLPIYPHTLTRKLFLECSQYFPRVHLTYNSECSHFLKINKYLLPVFSSRGTAVAWILTENPMLTGRNVLECSLYFWRMPLKLLYIELKFQPPNYNSFWDMIYFLRLFSTIFGPAHTTDDRQKVMHMSPPCKLHRWAKKTKGLNI